VTGRDGQVIPSDNSEAHLVDDRTEMLIRRNRVLLALAARTRDETREAVARAAEHMATMARLLQPRADSSPSADVGPDVLFCC
jgi:hypothetical protein